MQNFGIKKNWRLTPIHAILLVAILLRLPYVFITSYTHDELSALNHLQNAGWGTVWNYILHDYHPPLVQFFLLAYTGILGPIAIGLAEWVVKLPFALCGIYTIWVVYKTGRTFFNEPAGLYTAALMAVCQLFVFHSNVTRPYAPGLLFTVLFMQQWLKMLLHNDRSFKTKLAYVVFAVLAGATHYFAGITAGLAGVVGLLMIKRQQLVPYLVTNVVVIISMLPLLYIMKLQLAHGGLGGWLGAPEENYFWKFVSYLFHYNIVFLLSFFLVLATGVFFAFKNKIRLTFLPQLSMMLVFVLVFLVAYLYSVYVSPVIQFSILQFALPFVLLALFSVMGNMQQKILVPVFCFLLLGTGLYSLFFTRLHHQMMKDYPYKAFADFCAPYQNNHTWIVTSDRPEFLARYMDTSHVISTYGKPTPTQWVLEQLQQKKPTTVIAGNADPVTFSMLRSYCPVVENSKSGFLNEFYVLKTFPSGGSSSALQPHRRIVVYKDHAMLDSTHQYFGLLDTLVADLHLEKNFFLGFKARAQSAEGNPGILVVELHQHDSLTYWLGIDLFVRPDSNQLQVTCAYVDLTAALKKADPLQTRLKVYLWNNQLRQSRFEEITLGFSRPNYQYYGLTEDIYP